MKTNTTPKQMSDTEVMDLLWLAMWSDAETIEDFLNAIGNDEVVLRLHMAIHKYFGD